MSQDSTLTNRRGALECMLWAGSGVLWTISGGIPSSRLIGTASAAETGFSFVQISDSHIGFRKPANPDAALTLLDAITKISAIPAAPAFMIHTGDITHAAQPAQFDTAHQIITSARLKTFYAPGEHDILDPDTYQTYLARFGKGAGGGWYSFDYGGVHFISLVNVTDLKANGLGYLGPDQLEWLESDLRSKTASTPIVVFAHIPLWTIAPDWGWGTLDAQQALSYLSRFGSVTVLNGHIHQVMQKIEGAVSFHTARSTAFPQPAPGTAPAPGPMLVAAGKLRSMLGITQVAYTPVASKLAITDQTLSA